MAKRRRTLSADKRVKLTLEEIRIAARQMMGAAQAHQRASGWCLDKPGAKPPNIDCFFFSVVSFELILLSVEQSLRLFLLLHYSIVRDDTNHNPHVLYKTIRNKSRGKEGVRHDIISKMNLLGQTKGIDPVSENELAACLRKHDSSYSNFRYFQLDHQAKLNKKWEYSSQDVQILHCLALALIHLNMDEMESRGIGAIRSMSRISESEMTEELKVLKDRMIS